VTGVSNRCDDAALLHGAATNVAVRTRLLAAAVLAGAALLVVRPAAQSASFVQFVFTSDAHYGITRKAFRGHQNADGHTVNRALVDAINSVASMRLPADAGVRAGEIVGGVDFLAEGGDIANREEVADERPIQSAAESWRQFKEDYVDGLRLTAPSGERTPIDVVPGNHEASNAVGFWKPMFPPTDNSALIAIYNWMLAPPTAKTPRTFDYNQDRVLYTREVGGIHLMFLHVWPDSAVRAWIEKDLKSIASSTPVFLFTHDQPDVESKHFINPNGAHGINDIDKFENLLADRFADGATIDVPSTIEQADLEAFLDRHPNITAYFHGNSNWNQFYDWAGPRRTLALHTFRVDSPMKGARSAADETALSFQLATLDTATFRMTVRECLWNTDPSNPAHGLVWGDSRTVSVAPAVYAVGTSSRR